MHLGTHLFHARKRKGLSQEAVAERLGVSRQTVSKWETGETLPDIRQAKRLAVLYGVTLDELIDFDPDMQDIQDMLDQTGSVSDKIDWTKAWSRQYPILAQYQSEVQTGLYAAELGRLLDDLKGRYRYDERNAFLVLKDILGSVWKERAESHS